MSLQYLSNEKGEIVAVQVPIKEWEELKNKFAEIDASEAKIPGWQKELIDARLDAIAENPKRILSIESLLAELDDNLE
jgi:hypothetical protein